MIEITCWAPTRQEAIAFMQAVAIATVDAKTGEIVPIAEVVIHPTRPDETIAIVDVPAVMDGMMVLKPATLVPGWHWNMKFHGSSAARLTKPTPEGGWLPEHDVFDRSLIRELVEQRTSLSPSWIASAEDKIPPGYAVNNVRAFDPALIATRANIWQ